MPPIRVSAVRLAFSPTTVGVSAGDLVSLSVEAERLGYDSAWVAEVAGPEAFSLAGAIAVQISHPAPSASRPPRASHQSRFPGRPEAH